MAVSEPMGSTRRHDMQSGWLQQFMRKRAEDAANDSTQPSASPADAVSRRTFMQSGLAAGVAAGSAAAGGLTAGPHVAQAQTPAGGANTPTRAQRRPPQGG